MSWYRELVFLRSGNEGSLHLCFHQIRYSLSPFFFFFPSWVIVIPASLALLGWGRGRRRKQLGSFPGQLGGI